MFIASVAAAIIATASTLGGAPTDSGTACWLEFKSDGSTELLWGDVALMPSGSLIVDCSQTVEA